MQTDPNPPNLKAANSCHLATDGSAVAKSNQGDKR